MNVTERARNAIDQWWTANGSDALQTMVAAALEAAEADQSTQMSALQTRVDVLTVLLERAHEREAAFKGIRWRQVALTERERGKEVIRGAVAMRHERDEACKQSDMYRNQLLEGESGKLFAQQEEKIVALTDQFQHVMDALHAYGVHPSTCTKWWHHQIEGSHLQPNVPCSCGLDAALAQKP